MKVFAILAALAGFASGVDYENWQPPAPRDVRSPCPGLNSLANHNILPHHGRNYTVPVVVKALMEAVNFTEEVAMTVARAALRTADDPSSGTFDLDNLKKHGIIEHDASITRKDVFLGGEDQQFCPEIFNEFLGYFDGTKKVNLAQAAAARWGRVQTEQARNPKFSYTDSERFQSYGDSVIYHNLLRDPLTREASIDWIKIFFSEERLPYKEGWRPINQLSGLLFASDMLKLAMYTPEKASRLVGDASQAHGVKAQQCV